MKKNLVLSKSMRLIFGIMLVMSTGLTIGPAQATGFTTSSENDTTSPIISNLMMSKIGSSMAIINWETDEASDSQIKYKSLDSSDQTVRGDTSFKLNHNMVLTNLNPETSYQVTIISTDASGNTSTSNLSFTTTSTGSDADEKSFFATSDSTSTIDEAETTTSTDTTDPSEAPDTTISTETTGPSEAPDTTTSTDPIAPNEESDTTTNTDPSESKDGPITPVISTELSEPSEDPDTTSSTEQDSTTTEPEEAITLTSTHTSSLIGPYTNTVDTTTSSVIETTPEGQIAENKIGSLTQKIKLMQDGTVESFITILDDQNNSQVTKLTSSYEGLSAKMQDNGQISLKFDENKNAELKTNGALSICTGTTNTSKTCVEITIPKSQTIIDKDGNISVLVTKQVKDHEHIINIAIEPSGIVTTRATQKDLNNNQTDISTIASGQSINSGAQIIITSDGIKIMNISNERIDF